jgi:2-amino-4-hydroxy-6-hydroxymethyldihydropteridine diphosphokinase/dihydropteroate synthase
MVAAVRDSNCKLVVMHSLCVPADKNIVLPANCDPVAEVLSWAQIKIAALEAKGIARTRLIFDIGVGFGKTASQSQKLIDEITKFKSLGIPLLVGHSRKSFLDAKNLEDADEKTLKISQFLTANGVDYLRVHNVQIHKKAK